MLRTVSKARPRSTNFELWSWLFMRISGALLFVLVLVHIAILDVSMPVENVNYNLIVSRWASPLWRWYDLLMLGLGWIHGLNGTRVVMDDWIHSPGWRLFLTAALWVVGLVVLLIGAQVILSFPVPAARG